MTSHPEKYRLRWISSWLSHPIWGVLSLSHPTGPWGHRRHHMGLLHHPAGPPGRAIIRVPPGRHLAVYLPCISEVTPFPVLPLGVQ